MSTFSVSVERTLLRDLLDLLLSRPSDLLLSRRRDELLLFRALLRSSRQFSFVRLRLSSGRPSAGTQKRAMPATQYT